MPIHYVTGREPRLSGALFDALRHAHERSERTLILVVPAQYALQAERDALDALHVRGSFRLQVLPPERLYARIFEQAGQPESLRINDQGRVMLMYAAQKRMKDEFVYYRTAREKTGFLERAIAQIALFKQAGMTPEDVLALSERSRENALRDKLRDLSRLFGHYEALMQGRFMDAEDEAREAAARVEHARLLADSQLFVYGFDLLQRTLGEALLAIERRAHSVDIFLALENDGDARDFHLYKPVQSSYERFQRRVLEEGVAWSRSRIEGGSAPDALKPDVRFLLSELFAWPHASAKEKPPHIHAVLRAHPQEEAEYAAAWIRDRVMNQGYRYHDFTVAIMNLNEYADLLPRAFLKYDVPLFINESRPADKHPLSICLMAALKVAADGCTTDAMEQMLRTGFMDVTGDEADRLLLYARAVGLNRGAWLKPLTRGDEETRAALEPVRLRACAPLQRLSEGLRASRQTRDRLGCVYQFLTDIRAKQKLEALREMLTREGQLVRAAECAQVWSRILNAMDQMAQLMDRQIALRELRKLLEHALSATEVKALPQSPDAVSAGSIDHMKTQSVRAVLFLGLTDTGFSEVDSLLNDRESAWIAEVTGAFLRLDSGSVSRFNRLTVKSLIARARQEVLFSCPVSDMQLRAVRPGELFNAVVNRLFPALGEGLSARDEAEALLLNAPAAALSRAPAALRANARDPAALSALQALGRLDAYRPALQRVLSSFRYHTHSDPLAGDLVRAAYGGLDRASVTRLQTYIRCPFRHYVEYALRPEPERVLELTPRDSGIFYHEALESFMKENSRQLSALETGAAAERMDEITGELFDTMIRHAAGDDAVALSEGQRMRDVARRAAKTIVAHMKGSRFEPLDVEIEFNRASANVLVGKTALYGRIDRVDAWSAEDGKYLRIIDYKKGQPEPDLVEMYYGLQLQLIVYLTAAMKQTGGHPAGTFYFSVHDPVIKTDSLNPEEVEKEREKATRMKGLALKDERVIQAMGPEPERIMNASLKRNSARVLSEGAFAALMTRTLRQAEKAVDGILSGDTKVRPAQVKRKLSCEYCDYLSICQRDPNIEGGEPRILPKADAKEILERLESEAEGGKSG